MSTSMSTATKPLIVAGLFLVGCVTTGTHEAAIAAEHEKQAMLQKRLDASQTTLAETEQARQDLLAAKQTLESQVQDLDNKLTSAVSQNQTLITKVNSMGQNVEQLLGEKDSLAAEREKLNAEVAELRRMQKAAEARNAEYNKLLGKLAKMIDAGSLQVKIRNGRMLVNLSSDVLFSPGRATLKPEAVEAIEELAVTLVGFPDRKFQVIGHSDSTPIATARFPSNWELSSQRAIEVVKVLVNAGVPATMLSAAGAADSDPIAPNDTPENKTLNRRVELVFEPKIEELPGFNQMLSAK